MPSLPLPPCCTLADAACLSRALHQRTPLHGADAQCCGETQCCGTIPQRNRGGAQRAVLCVRWRAWFGFHPLDSSSVRDVLHGYPGQFDMDMWMRICGMTSHRKFLFGTWGPHKNIVKSTQRILSYPSMPRASGHLVDSAPADVALDDRI
ncbi:hypothetical protein B0H10DRAFT_2193218 [Mycena sp. CBHHK59/15]|nr:hypothetical protein B0H10DRAFT_2193218 [Mycena sp. CBHHK59/15]